MTNSKIIARQLNASERASTPASFFGARFIAVESFVFETAESLSPDYEGGFWEFFVLSNGGFYMAPTAKPRYRVECGNGFDGCLSADALGATACLYAYSFLSFSPDPAFSGRCADHYYLLREFCREHAEAAAVFGATD